MTFHGYSLDVMRPVSGMYILMVVTVFAMLITLSTLMLMWLSLSSRSSPLYTFNATKQMQTSASSIRQRVKQNMGRISIFDFAIQNALSTFHRLW